MGYDIYAARKTDSGNFRVSFTGETAPATSPARHRRQKPPSIIDERSSSYRFNSDGFARDRGRATLTRSGLSRTAASRGLEFDIRWRAHSHQTKLMVKEVMTSDEIRPLSGSASDRLPRFIARTSNQSRGNPRFVTGVSAQFSYTQLCLFSRLLSCFCY